VDDAALMDAALEQAALGLAAGEVPIGAVAVADGEIVAQAFWRFGAGLLAHPELLVMQEANRRGLSLYTTLEPCLLCMAAAMFSFCERVVYALESPSDGGATIGAVWDPGAGSVRPYNFPRVVSGVGRDESAALVREFLRRNPDARWAQTLPI
jgi:tRNA(adenine34) deaminase